MNLKENEKLVSSASKELIYSGRIDFLNPERPIFIFPGSSVSMMFTGSKVKALVKNNHDYNDNYIGCIIDGVQKKILLPNEESLVELTLWEGLESEKVHEVTLFKRQDGCHEFTFCGFIIPEDGGVNPPPKKTRRCIEFYGESSAAGELVEDENYKEGQGEKHMGEYCNAWHSYAMMTGRNLKADVSIIAQGGMALLDGTGHFHAPDSIGMESIYDKLHFNPSLGKVTYWDFKAYTPHVVVIDIGQNDAFPEDYMKKDKDGEKARLWREHYKEFVLSIRKKYPEAFIVLTTTIVNHHPSWDRAIGLVCREIDDKRIQHFLYSLNGLGTPFCPRVKLAKQMAFELSIFLKGLEPEIWNTSKTIKK